MKSIAASSTCLPSVCVRIPGAPDTSVKETTRQGFRAQVPQECAYRGILAPPPSATRYVAGSRLGRRYAPVTTYRNHVGDT